MRKFGLPNRNVTSDENKGSVTLPGAARSTSDLLSILNPVFDNDALNYGGENDDKNAGSVSNQLGEKEGILENVNPSAGQEISNKRTFSVVWGKQTKRKHKVWEGDGMLEVFRTSGVLRDMNGTVLARSSNIKIAKLEEGSIMFVGGKELQILEELSSSASQKLDTNSTYKEEKRQQSVKRFCLPSCRLSGNRSFVSPVMSDTATTNNVCDPLIMPEPNNTHQWECNTEKKPVTKVELDAFLTRVLRPHQREGVVFLYSCVVGFKDTKNTGAILADEMGLGKTLQCIAIIWLLLKSGPYGNTPVIRRVLIVTPSSLVNNWEKEFKKWLGFRQVSLFTVNKGCKISDFKFSNSPVMIISYEMLLRHYASIEDVKFDLLICDEGHRLKNNAISTFQFLNKIDCRRRILLTGTPIQNNLHEFYALVSFVNPGVLGTPSEFKRYYEDPIIASNQDGCAKEVAELGKLRAKELYSRTSFFILRRTQEIINTHLPSKQDIVVLCRMMEFQAKLYKKVSDYLRDLLDVKDDLENSGKYHLAVITALKKICNHPLLLKSLVLKAADEDGFKSFLSIAYSEVESEMDIRHFAEHSGKMAVLNCMLDYFKSQNEKVVLVSYYTQTLDLLENLCSQKTYSFLRLDGSTAVSARIELIDKFNSPNSVYSVFLLSAKAGGVGFNLTGASRLILYDLDWNPASDLQAMSRIWRDGQKKNTYIYRLLTTGSIEERIYLRQISKTNLSDSVVNTCNASSLRFSTQELKDLSSFDENTNCLTHDMLRCNCDGNGVPSDVCDEQGEDNDACLDTFLLTAETQKSHEQKSNLNITKLMQWEHFFPPFEHTNFDDLGLGSIYGAISFIFRNKKF